MSGQQQGEAQGWQRAVLRRYRDPLEVIWLRAAHECGLGVERSDEVFAAWDGAGTLTLGSAETLDADDCLAQMIFHELCHALVEGAEGFAKRDWGLSNTDERHTYREHACLRLQAALADEFGLRQFLAPTTDHRRFYDGLPKDAMVPVGADDPTLPPAGEGLRRAKEGPWAATLQRALKATAALIEATAPFAPADSLWSVATGGSGSGSR
jgi:hypothetical protein